ncbi:hypothetical protein NA57DRAFT_56946 [Rhizodiscina lignyota]|uniref:Pre-rRNA-processing protein TSR2 n=1 Tax=Rhizodiscina lignyota TaxID=1504668 RepID=A0A9P4IEC2_9PEZI|nr:hypothetical protein NA57DRAFT_56946 [Rhizodiscina lignyota]
MASQARNGMSAPVSKPEPVSNPNATPEQKVANFTLAVSLLLVTWPALSLAVANSWGGPDSADKRDWLGGAIIDLFESAPGTDVEDVEDVLLQVMQDEFEVNLEDGSEVGVAKGIMKAREQCARGDFTEIKEMERVWRERKGPVPKPMEVIENVHDGEEIDDDEDYEDDDEDEDEDDGDVRMGDAEALVPDLVPVLKERAKKPEPEVDEDGFTKVVGKKKR